MKKYKKEKGYKKFSENLMAFMLNPASTIIITFFLILILAIVVAIGTWLAMVVAIVTWTGSISLTP